MAELNKELFQTKMTMLIKYYNHTPDQEVLMLYWNSFKKMSDSDFEYMIRRIVKEFIPTSVVRFPLIPHFKECSSRYRFS